MEFVKPKCSLIGQDSNIFNLIGIASKALRRAGFPEKAKELQNKVISEAHSYDDALSIILDFVEVC